MHELRRGEAAHFATSREAALDDTQQRLGTGCRLSDRRGLARDDTPGAVPPHVRSQPVDHWRRLLIWALAGLNGDGIVAGEHAGGGDVFDHQSHRLRCVHEPMTGRVGRQAARCAKDDVVMGGSARASLRSRGPVAEREVGADDDLVRRGERGRDPPLRTGDQGVVLTPVNEGDGPPGSPAAAVSLSRVMSWVSNQPAPGWVFPPTFAKAGDPIDARGRLDGKWSRSHAKNRPGQVSGPVLRVTSERKRPKAQTGDTKPFADLVLRSGADLGATLVDATARRAQRAVAFPCVANLARLAVR